MNRRESRSVSQAPLPPNSFATPHEPPQATRYQEPQVVSAFHPPNVSGSMRQLHTRMQILFWIAVGGVKQTLGLVRCRAGCREFAGKHIHLPTAPGESRPDRPQPELRDHLSSGPRCECSAGTYRKLPHESAEISPQQIPAATVRALRRNTRNKFCEIPTPSRKTSTAGIACRRPLRRAALPPLVALRIAGTNFPLARWLERLVSPPAIPHTDRSSRAPTVLRASHQPLHPFRPA